MGAIETELRVNRRNTLAFIAARPTLIGLERPQRTKLPSGGYKDDTPEQVAAQTFRIIGQTTASGYTPTTDGTARNVEFVLLGAHDADVRVGDRFVHDSRDMIVNDIIEDNGYELRAVVTQRGKKR